MKIVNNLCIVLSKKVLDAMRPPIGSPLLFVYGVAHVKKHKLDAKGPPIGSSLLFVSDTVHVKNLSYMLRDCQSGTPCCLYVTLRM
jgi:hypothetical protein